MLHANTDSINHAAPNVTGRGEVQGSGGRGIPSHASMQALKARGWTATMIDDLLGEPDHYADNPHY